MLKTLEIYQAVVAVVTFDPIIMLLLGLLIGLLVGLIVGSSWRARTPLFGFNWLTVHDRIMGGLLMLAVFTLGAFVTYVLVH
ncbi:MAG TPA: hypothetical protein VMP08_12025 [Anaerolineae bacterium]|nr:hypothetical protein [Anaerolineae bacterium]